MQDKKYYTEEEITARHEAWAKIISEAKELFPHSKDVIYKLTVWCHNNLQPRYPEFKIRKTSRYYFHTLEDAEGKIQEIILRTKEERKKAPASNKVNCCLPYCFIIDELPIGEARHWRNEVQAWWVYDKKGKMVVSSLASEMCNNGGLEPFFGRFPESCPVRKGDIVEIVCGDEVHLEIVYSLPLNPIKGLNMIIRHREQMKNRNPDLTAEQISTIFCNDYTDDCYITLDGTIEEGQDTYMCAHSHPYVKWVFPAKMKVPDNVRKKLEFCLERVEKEIEENITS